MRPVLSAVTDKPIAPQRAGARLDRPAVHIEPCRQFIGGKAMRASIADCALCHTLEPPQLGSKGIGDRKRTRLNSSHSCASRMPSSACKNKFLVKTTTNTTITTTHTGSKTASTQQKSEVKEQEA